MNASQDRKATELQSALAIASPSDYKNRRIDFRDIAWCILDEGQGSFKSRLSKDYFKNLREITYTGVSH